MILACNYPYMGPSPCSVRMASITSVGKMGEECTYEVREVALFPQLLIAEFLGELLEVINVNPSWSLTRARGPAASYKSPLSNQH